MRLSEKKGIKKGGRREEGKGKKEGQKEGRKDRRKEGQKEGKTADSIGFLTLILGMCLVQKKIRCCMRNSNISPPPMPTSGSDICISISSW